MDRRPVGFVWVPYLAVSTLVLSYGLGTDPRSSWFGSGWLPFLATYLVGLGTVVAVTAVPITWSRSLSFSAREKGRGEP